MEAALFPYRSDVELTHPASRLVTAACPATGVAPPLSPPCKPDKSLWRHSRAPTHSATYTQPRVTVQTERLSTSCPKRSTVHMRVWRQSCQLSFFFSSSLSLPPFFPPSLPLLFHSPLGFFFFTASAETLLLWQLH